MIAGNGIARTFQNIRLLSSMTVLENVQVAIDRRLGRGVRRWLIFAIAWLVVGGGLVWGLLPAVWPERPAALNTVFRCCDRARRTRAARASPIAEAKR